MLALLSVSDKRGLQDFAQGLHRLGFSLLSTGGTLEALKGAGVPARKVSEHTGSPEILGGRVKTLHPRIHGGILANLDLPGHRAELEQHGIPPISLVAVNLYPFRETIQKGASFAEAVEQIDVGGPAMVRAAAKNSAHVAVVVDPDDYPAVLSELQSTGAVSAATRRRLMHKAFAHTAAYDAAIARYLQDQAEPGADPFPPELTLPFQRAQVLRYGENPHQRAALYRDAPPRSSPTVAFASVLQGKELSYNNLLDLDAALALALELSEAPGAAIIKHNTPCGVAVAPALEQAYRTARAADEVSAFGGIVALNREVDEPTAAALAETFLEAIIAPGYSPRAREVLAAKKNLRLLETSGPLVRQGAPQLELRSISGGLLVQDRDEREPDQPWKVVTRRAPTDEEMKQLRFAWRVCKLVKSNAIVFATADRLVAAGGGQTSRVDSVKIAAARGGERIKGTACASDAFFPFRDGLDEAARAGAGCVVQPGGSVRDAEVIAAADEHGLAMVFTGVRHFRH
ncbi:MAG TPA: bifunctional phosphoribosylaminoimidazolecarboxamide formyltransferase/IMP cyclohydrolase [Myxococcales bacterium]|nr:bifunctional phosphoribosylaminoimidazolecarboxamide formyltransferase/IMP cyclohydrolase [Myxococcales bacterium]